MTIDNAALQKRLKDGIQAIRDGNRVRGRDLLLEVVRADRNVEQAWWWLQQVVNDDEERRTALENVVRLNPQNDEAQQALLDMRQKALAAAPQPAPWTSLLPEVPLEVDDGINDPYQCPYCGRPTGVDIRRCPHCRGGLYWLVTRSSGPGSLRMVLLLLGISFALGVLELAGPLFALAVVQGTANRAGFGVLLDVAGVEPFLGNFLALNEPVIRLLLKIYVVRAGLFVAIILGLRERWTLAYYSALIGVLGDLLLSFYLLITGYLGFAGAALNGTLALGTAVLLYGLNYEFAVNHERILVKPDGVARNALDFYKRGHYYRKQGMWAMAVAQWRKAVGLAPQVSQYYKHLGLGYAQIKRFDRSLRALEEAQRQAPNDREIGEILALVRAKAETNSLLRR